MPLHLTRPIAAIPVCLLALTLGCEEGGGGTAVGTTTAIEASVLADGSAREGVTVGLYRPGEIDPLGSAVTSPDGTVVFDGLDPVAYDVEVYVPAGFDLAREEIGRKTVSATAHQLTSVSFLLAEIPAGGTVEITLEYPSLTFNPAHITLRRGTTVRWRNTADVFHTITPDGHEEWRGVTMFRAGETFDHTFDAEGEFPYYCEVHRTAGMVGTITVQ